MPLKRNRNLLFVNLIGLITFLVVYTNFDTFETYTEIESEQFLLRTPRSIYKKLECYQKIYRGLYNKTHVVKGNENINKFVVVTRFDLNTSYTKIPLTSSNEKLDKTELSDLIEMLFSSQAFLADAKILNETEFVDASITKKTKLSSHAIYKIRNFAQIGQYLKNSTNSTTFLTFGFEIETLQKLKDFEYKLDRDLNPKCAIQKASVQNEILIKSKSILAGFYIHCNKLVVHLAVFYTRGAFFWISNDDYSDKNASRVFGDRPRSMNK
jgi:hypothetical protein